MCYIDNNLENWTIIWKIWQISALWRAPNSNKIKLKTTFLEPKFQPFPTIQKQKIPRPLSQKIETH